MDIILLSQHGHIPYVDSTTRTKKFSFFEQTAFTRSLSVPVFIEKHILFYFNRHELHHAFPHVPFYHYHKISYDFPQTYPLWSWAKEARRMDINVFLLEDYSKTKKRF